MANSANRQIHQTLAEAGARGLGIFDGPNGTSLKFYSVFGTVVILQDFGEDCGMEVYAPIESNNSLANTLQAIRDLAQRV